MNEDASLVRKYRDYELEEERTEKGIRNEILAEGKEIGIQETKKEMVLAMYAKNLSLDDIEEISGLSQKEVENIINDGKSQ